MEDKNNFFIEKNKNDIFSDYMQIKEDNELNLEILSDNFFYKPNDNFLNKYFDNNIESNEYTNNIQKDKNKIFNNNNNDIIINNEKLFQNQINQEIYNNNNIININNNINNNENDYFNSLKYDFFNKFTFNNNNNNNNNNNFLNKKKFHSNNLKDTNSEREKKLLKNRISAKKSRQKKKEHILELEKQVKLYKMEIDKYKLDYDNNLISLNFSKILTEKEKDIETKKKNEQSKLDYNEIQKNLLQILFSKQIQNMIPIECKIFQNKFIKLLTLNEIDSPEILLNKINENLKILNELYEFKKIIINNNYKEKDLIAYKLYKYYENLKKFVESFIINLKIIG